MVPISLPTSIEHGTYCDSHAAGVAVAEKTGSSICQRASRISSRLLLRPGPSVILEDFRKKRRRCAEGRLLESLECGLKIDVPGHCCVSQDGQRCVDRDAEPCGNRTAIRSSISKRSAASSCARAIAARPLRPAEGPCRSKRGAYLQPGRGGRGPTPDRVGARGGGLGQHLGRDDDAGVHRGQDFDRLDEDQVVERRSVSDDQHVRPGACGALRSRGRRPRHSDRNTCRAASAPRRPRSG